MTHTERTYALRCWGFSSLESEFLTIAALHSGYFLRRQFDALHKSGSQTQRFIEKLEHGGHVARLTSGDRTVFHLNSAALYKQIGEPGSRNRRSHSLAAVKDRLMGLDFILRQVDERPLLTAEDKRTAMQAAGVEEGALPFSIHKTEKRYFPENLPLLVHQSGTVTFGFIDSGTESVKRFAEWMRRYSPLFTALDTLRVVYVCCSPDLRRYVREVFDAEMFNARLEDYDETSAEIVGYFQLRWNWENRKVFFKFGIAELNRLKVYQERFAGEKYEEMYQTWLRDGNAAIGCSEKVTFDVDVLPFDYTSPAWHWRTQQSPVVPCVGGTSQLNAECVG